jgi:YVTN family beta-propeller protein
MGNFLGKITAAAGSGAGDGGLATQVQMDPANIAIGTDGSVYIADAANHRIRRVSSSGTITTVAGNGTGGYSGDGGAAPQAQLHAPKAVAVGADGSLYIADTGNHRIRRVSSGGTITTVAGNGIGGYSGDGGPAAAAQLNYPENVVLGADGSLYIADRGNNAIRRIASNGTITTVAGNGTYGYSGDGGLGTAAQLSYPTGVATAADGSLYIVDTSNHCLRRVGPDGTITTVAGNGALGYSGDGGPAAAAQLNYPTSVALAADGNLYLADAGNNAIRRIGSDGTITTVAGNGTYGYSGDGGLATAAQLSYPTGVALATDGSLYIADNGRIRLVNAAGIITTVAGNGDYWFSGDSGPASAAGFNQPVGITVAADDHIYIVDAGNSRIRRIGTDGIITTVAGNGDDWSGGDGGPATAASFDQLAAVAKGSDGNLYIAEKGNHCIRRVGTNGVITTIAGNGAWGYSGDGGLAIAAQLYAPAHVAVGTDSSVYIADTGNHCIRRVGTNGIITTIAGNGVWGYSGDGGPAAAAQLYAPTNIAVGRDGSLYIADAGNYRVRRIGTNGVITTVAGNGTLGYSGDGGPALQAQIEPAEIAIGLDGTLYITDASNNYIRQVGPDGIITTLAGNGTSGYSGDENAATQAALNTPTGITVAANGSLYVADAGNNFIRKVPSDYLSAVWAANSSSSTVAKIINGAVAATLSPGVGPAGICVDKNNVVWVANSSSNTVSKIVNGSVAATISVADGPQGICVDKDNAIWVASLYRDSVSKIVNGAVVATISVGQGPWGICVDKDNAVWVADESNVSKIVNGTVVATISIGVFLFGICVDQDNAVWVAHTARKMDSYVSKIVNGSVVATISVGTGAVYGNICVDKDNAIWVTNRNSGSVSKIVNGAVVATISVGSYPKGICVDKDNAVWVTNYFTNVGNVSKIVNGAVAATIPIYANSFGDATGMQAALLFGWT